MGSDAVRQEESFRLLRNRPGAISVLLRRRVINVSLCKSSKSDNHYQNEKRERAVGVELLPAPHLLPDDSQLCDCFGSVTASIIKVNSPGVFKSPGVNSGDGQIAPVLHTAGLWEVRGMP